VLHGGEIPMTSWIPPGMLGHEPGVGLAFDPERARRDLADAGFAGGRGFPDVEVADAAREDPKLVAESLESQWRETLGVTVRLRQVEWKAYLKEISTDPPGIWGLGWGADYPDPDNFMNLFTAASGQKHTGWSSARFDALAAAAPRRRTPRRRRHDGPSGSCARPTRIMPLYCRAEPSRLARVGWRSTRWITCISPTFGRSRGAPMTVGRAGLRSRRHAWS
jgi:ABC-type oligopeptide transport system substrate-binding subunit